MQVSVRDNNVDQALRVLKKKLLKEGVYREMREKQAFETKGERRRREKKESTARVRREALKKARKEGLL